MKKPAPNISSAAVDALVAIVRQRVEWDKGQRRRDLGLDPTENRKELEAKKEAIERVRYMLMNDSWLQTIHQERENLYEERGLRQYLDKRPGHRDCEQIAADLADVQSSIDEEIASLPHPQQKSALALAALGFMYLWLEVSDELPTISETSTAVETLGDICQRAGIPRSPDRIKRYLSTAITKCDRHVLPLALHELGEHLHRPDLANLWEKKPKAR